MSLDLMRFSLSPTSTVWTLSSSALVSLLCCVIQTFFFQNRGNHFYLHWEMCVSSAGMFSYTMLATSPLFCYPDWPRWFFGHFPSFLREVLPFTSPDPQPSTSCVYKEVQSSSSERQESPPAAKSSKLRLKHKLGAVFTIIYIMEQFFMPYSHFITQVRHICLTPLTFKGAVNLKIKNSPYLLCYLSV